MKFKEDECCETCEYWDTQYIKPVDGVVWSACCRRYPPTNSVVKTGRSYWCGEYSKDFSWLFDDALENADAQVAEENAYEDFDDDDVVYMLTDIGHARIDTKDDDSVCLMTFDREYYNDRHDRYWCNKCNWHVDVDKGEKPKFCLYCGKKVYGCYCGGVRMD